MLQIFRKREARKLLYIHVDSDLRRQVFYRRTTFGTNYQGGVQAGAKVEKKDLSGRSKRARTMQRGAGEEKKKASFSSSKDASGASGRE